MKIVDLINAAQVMQKLMDQKMPAQLAYALAKNARMINHELEIYDQARVSILDSHWEKDPAKNEYKIPAKDQKEWEKLHNGLLQSETDYQPFKADFSLTEKIEISPGQLMELWFIFDGSDLGPIPARDLNNPAAAIDFP
jgi:hypothetical protein